MPAESIPESYFCTEWMKFPRDRLMKVFSDDDEVKKVIIRQVGEIGSPGGDGSNQHTTDESKPDNIRKAGGYGTDQTYTLRRLLRDEPALYERVASGELSANAAAIEAGFRERTITVKINPESAAKTICKHFNDEQLADLIGRLQLAQEALAS